MKQALSPKQEVALTGPLVVALVHDRLCTFEFAIVAEIFGLARPEMGADWYRFASASIEQGPLVAHGGLTFTAEGGLELLDRADLIVAAGWKGANIPVPQELTGALQRAWYRGARLASICSGAFVLAATGLLNGRRATTHWRYASLLAQLHPSIEVDPAVLYVEEDRIYTSAGSAAGIDLMIHIVRQDYGAEAANKVARRLVMPAHRQGGQAQFIERPVAPDGMTRLSAALDSVRRDLRKQWTVSEMARLAAMGPRTFSRRFEESTAQTPGQWLAIQRIEEARRLLESTKLTVEQIADLVGFTTSQALRKQFRAKLGTGPREYRKAFCTLPIRNV